MMKFFVEDFFANLLAGVGFYGMKVGDDLIYIMGLKVSLFFLCIREFSDKRYPCM